MIVEFEKIIEENKNKYNIPSNVLEYNKSNIDDELDAYYNSLNYLNDCVKKEYIKIIEGGCQINLKKREKIITVVFLRMYLLAQSIIKLNVTTQSCKQKEVGVPKNV